MLKNLVVSNKSVTHTHTHSVLNDKNTAVNDIGGSDCFFWAMAIAIFCGVE